VARHQCHFVRFMWILSLVGLFKPKTNAGVCREFAAGTFGTSSWVKNVAWDLYNFVGFQLILSLVGVYKAKPDPAICRGKVVERLVRIF
jgi:hypothetical protein